MSQTIIEIGGHTKSPLGKRLSNFEARQFVFDGVKCASFEGFIQSLKCPDPMRQLEICKLSGIEAKRAGAEYDNWKDGGYLYWKGTKYYRLSRDYMMLINRVYDAIYEQDANFRVALQSLGDADIWHSIGHPDPRETTLTEQEMLMQYNRLRIKHIFSTLKKLGTPDES